MASGPVELRTIETNIPARMDRLPWARWHWLVVIGLGRGVDPRRPRGDDRRHDREPPDRGGLRHPADGVPDRLGRRDLRRRRLRRRAVLRPPRRPDGAQEAVHDHAARLPGGDGRDGVLGLVPVLRGLPLLHRRGHRRRVRGDQLGHRRADPRARARHRRPDHQRLVLARHGGRARCSRSCCSTRVVFAADVGWRVAFGLGAILGLGDPARAPLRARSPRAGCSSTGATRRPRRSSRTSSARWREQTGAGARGAAPHDQDPPAPRDRLRHGHQDRLQALPEAHGARASRCSSGRRSSTTRSSSPTRWCWTSSTASAPTRWAGTSRPSRSATSSGRCCSGRFFDSVGRKPMIAGTYILSGVLLAVTAILFQSGTLTATTQTAAWCVIFFFASAGRERRLPDGLGDLPDGDARDGDLVLLRRRHGDRRHHRPAAVRPADRGRRRDERDVRLPARRRADDRRRRRRDLPRRRGGAEAARGRGQAADRRGRRGAGRTPAPATWTSTRSRARRARRSNRGRRRSRALERAGPAREERRWS